MKHAYLFEVYKYGYDVESPEYVEYRGENLLYARINLFLALPKAYILNEYLLNEYTQVKA